MILYLEIGDHNSKPSKLRILDILLRCPVSEAYEREAGYCGKHISKDVAEQICREIDQTMKEMLWVEVRSSTAPPDRMFGAYCSSVSGTWKKHWGTSCLPERIRNTATCLDQRTIIWIPHGEDDLHVPWRSSRDLAATLRGKWPGLRVTFTSVPGKEHAWGRSDPLSPALKDFLRHV